MRVKFVPWSGSVTQWANRLSRQYGELEIWVRIPAKAQIFAVLAQMVACLPLVQRVRGSIHGEIENYHTKILNLGARSGGDVQHSAARLCI